MNTANTKALERILDETRFLSPDDAIAVLKEALELHEYAKKAYNNALGDYG